MSFFILILDHPFKDYDVNYIKLSYINFRSSFIDYNHIIIKII